MTQGLQPEGQGFQGGQGHIFKEQGASSLQKEISSRDAKECFDTKGIKSHAATRYFLLAWFAREWGLVYTCQAPPQDCKVLGTQRAL